MQDLPGTNYEHPVYLVTYIPFPSLQERRERFCILSPSQKGNSSCGEPRESIQRLLTGRKQSGRGCQGWMGQAGRWRPSRRDWKCCRPLRTSHRAPAGSHLAQGCRRRTCWAPARGRHCSACRSCSCQMCRGVLQMARWELLAAHATWR